MQGDKFATKPGGIMEVARWLRAPLLVGLRTSLGLVPKYDVVLVLHNECRGPRHMHGCPTRGRGTGFDFGYLSNIQQRLILL
jgi:hypothetical protein